MRRSRKAPSSPAVLTIPSWPPSNSPLKFRSWFPDYLKRDAHEMYWRARISAHHGLTEWIAMVERLVSDPRMERVWNELSKHKRDKSNYSKTSMFAHGMLPPESQPEAIRCLFLQLGIEARDYNGSRRDNLGLTKLLRTHASILEQAQPRQQCKKLAKKLIAAAAAYEEADQLHIRADAMYAVQKIAFLMRDLFGSKMLGLSSTVASVALDQEITPSMVREWTKP